MTDSSQYVVFVKRGLAEEDTLGDCPFSQRVLLTLEEEGIEHERQYIDLEKKPEWFKDVNPKGEGMQMKINTLSVNVFIWMCFRN